ncbi:TPA: lysis protein [Klebsiella quasipneumoniae subsp. similipneumoniae]|nr:lysis protein [Klebsiella quasipneumoniae subsp. similipneumoniae]
MTERILAVLLVVSSLLAFWYHNQLDTAQASLNTTREQLAQEKWNREALESMSASNAAIDKQHQEELASAKTENERLRADVERGVKRLRLSATCEPMRNGTTTTSGANDARPRLNDTAQRNYYTLRERIAQATSQINGLQSYIQTMRQQCPALTGQSQNE